MMTHVQVSRTSFSYEKLGSSVRGLILDFRFTRALQNIAKILYDLVREVNYTGVTPDTMGYRTWSHQP